MARANDPAIGPRPLAVGPRWLIERVGGMSPHMGRGVRVPRALPVGLHEAEGLAEKGWTMRRPRGFTPTRRSVWGFTLLELMMVVIIIGTLASIALPQYLKAAERARVAEALLVLSAIRGAEMRYNALREGKGYTGNLTDLDVTLTDSPLWNFSVPPGNGVVAERRAVVGNALPLVKINIDTGATCASDPIYGLTPCP